jgi:hypothetical protein
MRWYAQVHAAVQRVLPTLRATQAANLALLVGALLARRTLNLSDLARASPAPVAPRVARPKHGLLHRVKRLWRFLGNARVDAVAVQAAFIPHVVAALGHPRLLGLALDWTMFDTVLPSGARARYQVLRVAVPRCGRALPLLQVAYDRDALPADKGQGQLEEAALLAVLRALPPGVRPVVLADRGFARAPFLAWLQRHGAAFVVRVTKGTCLTEADGTRWKLGQRDPPRGALRWHPQVRYGLFHGRPRDVTVNLAQCWRLPRHQARDRRCHPPAEPWYLATNLASPAQAAAWYRQRGWIEQSFKDSKSRFGLAKVQVACPHRLSRLLAALTLALAWLALLALPGGPHLPPRWRAAVAQWGRPSTTTLALAHLDRADLLHCPYS